MQRTQGTHKCRRSEIRKVTDESKPWFWFLFGCLLILFLNYASAAWSPRPPPPSPPPSINPGIPIIAIMGRTGVGKSMFINTLGGLSLDEKVPPVVGHGLESCTFFHVSV